MSLNSVCGSVCDDLERTLRTDVFQFLFSCSVQPATCNEYDPNKPNNVSFVCDCSALQLSRWPCPNNSHFDILLLVFGLAKI